MNSSYKKLWCLRSQFAFLLIMIVDLLNAKKEMEEIQFYRHIDKSLNALYFNTNFIINLISYKNIKDCVTSIYYKKFSALSRNPEVKNNAWSGIDQNR